MTVLLVALAGGAGVLARFGLGRLAQDRPAELATIVAVNLAGSFLLGVLTAQERFGREARDALGTGFLGGFTTFSTFSVQAYVEARDGHGARAAVYLAVSIAGGLLAAAGGFALGRALR